MSMSTRVVYILQQSHQPTINYLTSRSISKMNLNYPWQNSHYPHASSKGEWFSFTHTLVHHPACPLFTRIEPSFSKNGLVYVCALCICYFVSNILSRGLEASRAFFPFLYYCIVCRWNWSKPVKNNRRTQNDDGFPPIWKPCMMKGLVKLLSLRLLKFWKRYKLGYERERNIFDGIRWKNSPHLKQAVNKLTQL